MRRRLQRLLHRRAVVEQDGLDPLLFERAAPLPPREPCRKRATRPLQAPPPSLSPNIQDRIRKDCSSLTPIQSARRDRVPPARIVLSVGPTRKVCGRRAAQTAMPRTRGDPSLKRGATLASSAASPELPTAISTLRRKRSRPTRLIGEPSKRARNAASSSARSSASGGLPAARRGLKLHLARGLRELVPGADGEAIVAAIDAVADRLAKLSRDRPLVLDGEVGNAAARIEPVGRRESARRAGVEAGAAGAAMVVFGRVGGKRGGGEDRAEEQPGAEIARDEVGVLALPAEPGRLRQRLLHHRRGIDENLDSLARAFARTRRPSCLQLAP